MKTILNEMAMDKNQAMDRCFDLSKKFVEHFDKIYTTDSDNYKNHWAMEMQAWLDSVLRITLKYNNKHLSLQQKMDWFFTSGSTSDDLFTNQKEAEKYDDFIDSVALTNDVKDSLFVVGLLYE